MCDRKILSSDPSDWDELISEAAGAEKYSRRLSERITEGYAAKFDQERRPGRPRRPRLPAPAGAAAHPRDRPRARCRIVVGLFERYALGQRERDAARGGDRARRHAHPDDPHEPALQRLDPAAPRARTRRAARHRGGRRRRSPTSCGRGWRRSGAPRPAVGDRRTGIASTCSAASSSASAVGGSGTTARSPTAATASSTPTRARPGAARPASATRPGRRRCWPRSPASRSTTSPWPRSSRPSGRASSRSRSTGHGSTGRSASSRWSTPAAGSATTPT